VFVAPNPYAAGTLLLEFWEPGAVLFLEQGPSAVEVMARAESALHEAKRAGRNRYAIFSASPAQRELHQLIGGIQQQVIATPSFTGQQQVAVEEFVRVNSLQLIVQEVPTSDDPSVERGQVVLQSPAAGTPLVKGSVVAITVFAPPA
jgi:hypothetical protein